jgi:2-iminobutanoate/2-iminopropanoate deaminase
MHSRLGAALLAGMIALVAGACGASPEAGAAAGGTAEAGTANAGTSATGTAEPARREIIRPEGANPIGPYSPGVRVGDLIFLSGAIGSRPGKGLVSGGIEAETRQALENLRNVLRAAGADMEDVVKCTVFLADIDDFEAMNRVYREFFPHDPPARSTVATELVAGAGVEIECIAAAPREP